MVEIFNYLSVIVSIVLGMAVAHTVGEVSKLIQLRDKFEIYWVQLLWVLTVFGLQVLYWWGTWIYQSVETWTFPLYTLYLLTPISLCVLSDLILPELNGSAKGSLKAYYFRNRGWFFGVFVGFYLLSGLNLFIVRGGGDGDLLRMAFRGVGILLLVVAGFSRSPRLHAVVAVASLLVIVGYVLVFTTGGSRHHPTAATCRVRGLRRLLARRGAQPRMLVRNRTIPAPTSSQCGCWPRSRTARR